MNNLAMAYRDAGRPTEALPLLEETLKLQKAKLGPDHPDTLDSMNNLAMAYQAAGRLDEAIPLYEETLKLQKAKLGPDHPDTLDSTQQPRRGLPGRRPARPRPSRCSRRRSSCGRPSSAPTTPTRSTARNNLAGAYRAAGGSTEADPLSEETLELARPSSAPTTPNAGDDLARPWAGRCCSRRSTPRPSRSSAMPGHPREEPARRLDDRSHQSLLGEQPAGPEEVRRGRAADPPGLRGDEGPRGQDPAPLKRELTEAGERVVRLYEDWGKPEEAAKWRAKLARELPAENNEPKP